MPGKILAKEDGGEIRFNLFSGQPWAVNHLWTSKCDGETPKPTMVHTRKYVTT